MAKLKKTGVTIVPLKPQTKAQKARARFLRSDGHAAQGKDPNPSGLYIDTRKAYETRPKLRRDEHKSAVLSEKAIKEQKHKRGRGHPKIVVAGKTKYYY